MLPKNGIDAISGRARSAARTATPSSPLCRLPVTQPSAAPAVTSAAARTASSVAAVSQRRSPVWR